VTGVTGLSELDDRTLASRIRQGDREAEATFASRYAERLRIIALARTRDRELARDIAQDALMAVLTALRSGQLRDDEKLTAFVHGTLRNLLNSSFRGSGRRPATEPLAPEHAVAVPDDPVDTAERTRLVRDALRQLGRDDRRILLMTLVQGLKPGEIARRMGLADEVVRTRKSRALKRIVGTIREMSRS
jgi:RNA polymerase sigma-70 factor (ECF subfamily)